LIESFHTVELSDPAYEHEGLRLATVKGRALGRRTDVSLWVPSVDRISTLLILLHGVYGSHWVWSHKAGAHRTAQRLLDAREISAMVIAMPNDGLERDGSGYLTWPGADVERFLLEEVPAIARLASPALTTDAKVAIAGLSMGGYGALRLGAKYPGRFCAISAHSAIVGIDDIASFVKEPLDEYLACAPREELDALHWIRRNRAELPPLRFDCGLTDPLLPSNRQLHEMLTFEGIPHQYEEFSGGHDWPYWQQHFEDTLRFVDRQSRGVHTP
jgi:putative tributyrin esterase